MRKTLSLSRLWTRSFSLLPELEQKDYFYQIYRREKFGKTISSYDGRDCSEEMCQSMKAKVEDIFDKEHYECQIEKAVFLGKESYFWQVYDKQRRDFCYLSPSYKEHLISAYAPHDYYFTSYAEYVYERLPPIFVGDNVEYRQVIQSALNFNLEEQVFPFEELNGTN